MLTLEREPDYQPAVSQRDQIENRSPMFSLKIPYLKFDIRSLPHCGQDTECGEFLCEVCVEFPLNFCYEDDQPATDGGNVIYRFQSMRAVRTLKRRPA